MDTDHPFDDELYVDPFESDDQLEYEPPEAPSWRKPLIIGVAVITAVAMALVPAYNLFGGAQRVVASNGLEVCGFDYCVIQEAMTAEGLDLAMSRFSNLRVSDDGAVQLAGLITDYLNISPVEVVVVDDLQGDIEGQYQPATRTIVVERPTSVWIVIHEVAHAVEPGHGEEFQEVLADITTWMDQTLVD